MTDQVPEDDGVEIQEVLVGQAQVALVVQNILQLLPQHQGTEVWEPQRFCCALTPVDTTQHCYILHTAPGDWGMGTPEVLLCTDSCRHNTCVTCYTQHQETEVGEPLRFCGALTPVDTTHMLHAAPGDWGRGTPVDILPCTDSCQCNTTKPTLHATRSTRRLR